MADIDVQPKVAPPVGGGGRGLQSWIWPLVAVIAVGGLMWWLAMESEATRGTAVVQEDVDAPAVATPGAPAPGAGAEAAELAGIAADPDTFVGRRIAVDNVEVAATLGPSGFWADIPGANPFLVMFSPDLTERPELASGQTLNVQGTVAMVTDSLLDVWVASGAIRPGARDEAAFATHYLLADLIVAQQ